MKAARWSGLEPNASWNRKLAVCLRNSGYNKEAIVHFERALELDHDLVEAHEGLATAYQKQGCITKVVDLELTNVEILSSSISKAHERGELTSALSKKLCISYEIIAHAYQHSGSPLMALKYYRKAAETTEIEDWVTVLLYASSSRSWQGGYRKSTASEGPRIAACGRRAFGAGREDLSKSRHHTVSCAAPVPHRIDRGCH
jgi:tetratricopeptide (TPR) repeat protein